MPRSGQVRSPQRTCISGEGSPSLRAAPDGRANGQTVKPREAFTRERTRGAPLAAMHKQLTLSDLQAA